MARVSKRIVSLRRFSCISTAYVLNDHVKTNKLHGEEFVKCLESNFIGPMETHADTNTAISLEGYYVFRKEGPKIGKHLEVLLFWLRNHLGKL